MAKAKEAPLSKEELQLQKAMFDMVRNELTSRSQFLRRLATDRRDINRECDYPETGSLTAEVFEEMYDREPIAARVVEVEPIESWKTNPWVYEDEDMETTTQFEEAIKQLSKSIDPEPSYYEDDQQDPLWEMLRRLDILSGIGHYGVLLLGVDDGQELSEPLQPGKGMSLSYLNAFPESLAKITGWESDKQSRRYGLPVEYQLTFTDPRETYSGVGNNYTTKSVHWSRVIHVPSDRCGSNNLFGKPRQQVVWNRLLDLRKTYGGSAEMYWRGGFPGLSLETHPQLGGDVEFNMTNIRRQFQDYMNGLQRYLVTSGSTIKSLAPQIADPSTHIDKQIEAICIVLGVPKRIFMGSERGELASGQDDDSWKDRMRDRQCKRNIPKIIVPFFNRLINLGVLPQPVQGFRVEYQDIDAMDPLTQSQVAMNQTQAIVNYVSGGAVAFINELDFATRVLGWSKEDAEAVVESSEGDLMAALEAQQQAQQAAFGGMQDAEDDMEDDMEEEEDDDAAA